MTSDGQPVKTQQLEHALSSDQTFQRGGSSKELPQIVSSGSGAAKKGLSALVQKWEDATTKTRDREGSLPKEFEPNEKQKGLMVFGDYYTVEDVPFGVQLLSNYSFVFLGSMLGVVIRIHLGILFSDFANITVPVAEAAEKSAAQGLIFYDLPANMIGAFLMGLFSGSQHWLLKFFPAVYTGLVTGLCGSLTTFGSWMLQASLLCYKGWVASGIGCIIIGFLTSDSLMRYGKDFAKVLVPPLKPGATLIQKLQEELEKEKTLPKGFERDPELQAKVLQEKFKKIEQEIASETKKISAAGMAVYNVVQTEDASTSLHRMYNTYKMQVGITLSIICTILLAALLGSHSQYLERPGYNRASISLALLLAPPGACLRYFASRYNMKYTFFPIYTFIVNMIGSILTVVVYKESGKGSALAQTVVHMLNVGLLGSFTTVASFVHEFQVLKDTNTPPINDFSQSVYYSNKYSVMTLLGGLGLSLATLAIWNAVE